MKKITSNTILVIICGLTTMLAPLFTSCKPDKLLLTDTERSEWTIKGDTIYRKSIPVAVYDHTEYELNPEHGRHTCPCLELSITQFDRVVGNTVPLIKFIHTIHKKNKVEIVIPNIKH